MKKKINEANGNNPKLVNDKNISRKTAIKKSGTIAIAAASTLLLLSVPNKAQAGSPAPPPGWG